MPSFNIEDMMKARKSKFSVFNSRCVDLKSRSTSPVVNYLDDKQKSKYSTPKGGDDLSDLPLNQEVKPDSQN